MSSEVFGKDRLTEPSTRNPKQELLAETAHIMAKDSAHDVHHQPGRSPKGGYPSDDVHHSARFRSNLSHSAHNSHATQVRHKEAEDPVAPEQIAEEDPSNMSRRRQEKNFSDLFGVQMGGRQQIQGRREEVIGSKTCSFLDTRSEIAHRNQAKWKHDDVHHTVRKEAEQTSQVFDRKAQGRPEIDQEQAEIQRQERSCWDSKDMMHPGSEISRRRRLRDHQGEAGYQAEESQVSAYDRKQVCMGSNQLRTGMGTIQGPEPSPRNAASRISGQQKFSDRPDVTHRDSKLASLQSSIFS